MWLRFRTPDRRRRGFSVLEALVSVIILVVVMTAAGSLLFSMKSFAQKQQSFAEPRQTSRAGLDYLSYFLEGAGDLNVLSDAAFANPNALIMWYRVLGAGNTFTTKQASFNNLTAAQAAAGLGDEGTDIITMTVPIDPFKIPVTTWPGYQHAANVYLNFSEGCAVSDAHNLYLFEKATGATPLSEPVNNGAQSGLLSLVDADGDWVYFQITSYQKSDCGKPPDIIHVVANPGQSGAINPPGGQPQLNKPINLAAGLQQMSFRIRNRNLEQKNGLFDPATDNPGTAFFPIMENVEDFQVAYIYGAGMQNGRVWNTTAQTIASSLSGVPSQAGHDVPVDPNGFDITNVIGVRISVTARSQPLPLSGRKMAALRAQSTDDTLNFYYRPASEDHAKGALDYVPGPNPLVYHHQRYTTTLMLRNRALGG